MSNQENDLRTRLKADTINKAVPELTQIVSAALAYHHEREKLVEQNCDYQSGGQAMPESIRLFTEGYLERLEKIVEQI